MKQRHPRKAIERFDTIDLLRGLSVLSVVYFHIAIDFLFSTGKDSIPIWLRMDYANYIWFGVPCFFAISGFLITFTSISRFGTLSDVVPSAFYRIRFARIAPPLLLVVSLLSALHLGNEGPFRIDPKVSTLPQAVIAVLTFQLNRLTAVHGLLPPPWEPLWSLSVEEVFYLCFPLLCAYILGRRWGRPVFLTVLVGFVAIGPFARNARFTANPAWAQHSYLSNMDNIALGCLFGLLAVSMRNRAALGNRISFLALNLVGVFLMLLPVAPALTKFHPALRMQMVMWRTLTPINVLGLGTCLVMLASVLKPSLGSRFTAPLRWLGRYSYEVYLTHTFVIMGVSFICFTARKGPLSLWAVAMILLSGLLGFVMSRYYSEPMNRLLRGAPLPSQLK